MAAKTTADHAIGRHRTATRCPAHRKRTGDRPRDQCKMHEDERFVEPPARDPE